MIQLILGILSILLGGCGVKGSPVPYVDTLQNPPTPIESKDVKEKDKK